MVVEEFCDLRNSPPCFGGLRCPLCGEIVDQVILENRSWLPDPRPRMRPNRRVAVSPGPRPRRSA